MELHYLLQYKYLFGHNRSGGNVLSMLFLLQNPFTNSATWQVHASFTFRSEYEAVGLDLRIDFIRNISAHLNCSLILTEETTSEKSQK
jgi:hypothetical protein